MLRTTWRRPSTSTRGAECSPASTTSSSRGSRGGKVLSLLRPDLERASLAALDDVPLGRVRLHYGTRVTDVETDGSGARIDVEGTGPGMSADVVIGADGIHSQVRAKVFGPESHFLRPLGMRAAAFIVRDPQLNAEVRNRFFLTDTLHRTAGLYGLRSDEVAAFLVYRDPGVVLDDPGDAVRERLLSEFGGLNPTVDRLLRSCPTHPYDDVVAQVVMPRWREGRTVLLGDACGAVSLLAGQGGSLAIAGATLLADLLGPISQPAGTAPALAEFERRWRPMIAAGQASGRRTASSFLPAHRAQLLLRRWVIRATKLPGIDRLVARMILSRIAT